MYVVTIKCGWSDEMRFRFLDRFEALQFMVDATAHHDEQDDGKAFDIRLEIDMDAFKNVTETEENDEADRKENQTVGAED